MKFYRFILDILHLINDGYLAMLAILLPFLVSISGFTLSQVGILDSMLKLSGIFVSIPAGIIARRLGGEKLLVFGLLLYSLAFGSLWLTTNYLTLLIAFALAGIGFGYFHPIALAEISLSVDKTKRGRALGNYAALGDVGRISLVALTPTLVVAFSFKSVSAAFCIFTLIAFVLIALAVLRKRENLKTMREEKNRNGTGKKMRTLFKNPKFITSTAALTLDSLASSAFFVFIPFFLLERGVSEATLGIFSSSFFIGNLFGKSTLGFFVDRYGAARTLISAEILMGLLIISLIFSHQLTLLFIISMILGAVTKGTAPVTVTLMSHSDDDVDAREMFGAASFIGSFGTTLSPIVLGFLANQYSIEWAFVFSAITAMVVCVPVFIYIYLERREIVSLET